MASRFHFMVIMAGLFYAVTVYAQPAPAIIKKGEYIFVTCASCHSRTADAQGKIGPSLYGVYGRKIASANPFAYSDSLNKRGSEIWDDKNLDAWLASSQTFAPGNKMNFTNMRDPAKRIALIAYLKSISIGK
jgi:cytochrome c